MSEPAIVAGIASALESRIGMSDLGWNYLVEDYDRIRDLIEQTIPVSQITTLGLEINQDSIFPTLLGII